MIVLQTLCTLYSDYHHKLELSYRVQLLKDFLLLINPLISLILANINGDEIGIKCFRVKTLERGLK